MRVEEVVGIVGEKGKREGWKRGRRASMADADGCQVSQGS
jgi:hypothetical protein